MPSRMHSLLTSSCGAMSWPLISASSCPSATGHLAGCGMHCSRGNRKPGHGRVGCKAGRMSKFLYKACDLSGTVLVAIGNLIKKVNRNVIENVECF